MLTAMPFVRAGKLRAIAVSTLKRSPQAPDLQTLSEAGATGYDVTPWYGVLAPAGLSKPLLARLHGEVAKIVDSPEMRERFVTQGVDVASSTPEAFAALIRAEIPRWRELVKRSGARAD
jgi:tripartite-type tricarboxylate transporter receptor subunit TctC